MARHPSSGVEQYRQTPDSGACRRYHLLCSSGDLSRHRGDPRLVRPDRRSSFGPADVRPAFGRPPRRRAGYPPGPDHSSDGPAHRPIRLRFILALATSLWTASSGVRALIDTLNIVYGEDEKRGLVKLYLFSLAATIAIIVFFIVVSLALIAVPLVLDYIWIGELPKALLDLLRWPILFCIAVFAIAVIYRYGPSRREARWRWITWGSALAVVLWLVASLLFSWYEANFGSYNKTYGSLGAVIGFMTWMWISATVLLLGAEVNAETEHQTVRDTTVGGDKPMGRRGAWVADTKGKAQK